MAAPKASSNASTSPKALRSSFLGRLTRASFRVMRRRFFFIVSVVTLLTVLLVFFGLLVLFQPGPVNSIAEFAIEKIFNPTTQVTFDQSRTTTTFPKLNGRGSISLYNLRIRSSSKQYDWLHAPTVRIDYDLSGLPSMPVSRVALPDGLYAVLNLDEKGAWLDQDAFRPTEPSDSPELNLPEILIRNAHVRFRAPMALSEPTPAVAIRRLLKDPANKDAFLDDPFLYEGRGGHYLSNITATLLKNATGSGMLASISTECDQWGKASVTGTIEKNGSVKLRAVKRNLLLNSDLIGRLKESFVPLIDIAYAERTDAPNRIDLAATLELKPNEGMKLVSQLMYSGSAMYRDAPVLIHDIRSLVEYDLRDLKILHTTARLGAATVQADGGIFDLGGPNQRVDLDVNVVGLSLSSDLVQSAAGIHDLNGTTRFPDWEAHKRPGATTPPSSMDALRSMHAMLEPSGLANVSLTMNQEARTERFSLGFRVLLADASARYMGDSGALAKHAAEAAAAPGVLDIPSARSLARLNGAEPTPERKWEDPFTGFPLPLVGVSGVVSGEVATGRQVEIRVSGLSSDDALAIERTLGIRREPSRRGLVASRVDETQQVYLDVTLLLPDDEANGPDNSRFVLRASADGLRVDSELIALLPAAIRKQMDDLGLSGTADIESASVTLAPLSTNTPQFDIELRLRNVGGSYLIPGAAEPIRIERLRGNVSFSLARNELRARGITAGILDTVLRVDRVAMLGHRSTPTIEFSASLPEIPIGPSLFKKLPPEVTAFESAFTRTPTGTLSGSIVGRISPGRASETTVRLSVRGASLTHETIAPYTLHKVDADVTAVMREDGMEVRIHSFSGVPAVPLIERIGSRVNVRMGPDELDGRALSSLQIRGAVSIPGKLADDPRISLDLEVNANKILLTEGLREAVNKLTGGTADKLSTTAELWAAMEALDKDGERIDIGRVTADGRVSVRLPHEDGHGQKWPMALDYLAHVTMDGARITYQAFPLPLTDVSLEATVTTNSVSFQRLSAAAGKGRFSIPKLSLQDDQLLLLISVRDLPMDAEEFRLALPEALQGAMATINPRGLVDADITLRMAGERLEFDVALDLHEVGLTLGVDFEKCEGLFTVSGEFGRDPETGGIVPLLTKGQIKFSKAWWTKILIEDITTSVQVTADRFVLPNLRGRVHGGVFSGDMNIGLGEDGKYEGAIQARGILLESIAKVLAGGEDKEGGEKMVGGVDADLAIFSADENGLIGRGSIDIGRVPLSADKLAILDTLPPDQRNGEPAALGNVPLIGGLYRELNLTSGEYFNEARILFNLMSDRITIRQLNLVSDAIRVETVQDNFILYTAPERGDQINLVMVPTLFPRTMTLPFVQPVFDAVKGVVLRIFVGGTLDNPSVRPLSNRRTVGDVDVEEDKAPPSPPRSRFDG